MVLAPEHPLVERITTPEHAAAVEAYREEAARKSDLERTELAKKKTGVFTGAYAINPVNGERDPHLDRRLRAGQLRHRRDHGRAGAGRARLGVRRDLRICRSSARSQPPDGLAGQGVSSGDGPAINSGFLNGLHVAEAKEKITDWLEEQGLGVRPGQLQAARLALQPAALLGRAVPDPARAGRRRQADRRAYEPCRTTSCRSSCRSWRTSSRPAGPSRRWARRTRLGERRRIDGKTLQARDEHDAAVGRLVLVLPALPRPANDQALRRPGQKRALDAGRSVRRRRRARRAAPALLALLAQGAVRPRPRQHAGAVPAAGQPGHDPGRDGVSPATRTTTGEWVSAADVASPTTKTARCTRRRASR